MINGPILRFFPLPFVVSFCHLESMRSWIKAHNLSQPLFLPTWVGKYTPFSFTRLLYMIQGINKCEYTLEKATKVKTCQVFFVAFSFFCVCICTFFSWLCVNACIFLSFSLYSMQIGKGLKDKKPQRKTSREEWRLSYLIKKETSLRKTEFPALCLL